MRLGVLKEPEGETRVAIVPKSLRKLSKSGFEVIVESNAGIAANHYDSEYETVSYTHLTLPTKA